MAARLEDGTQHRLLVFPETEESTIQATWDNLFRLVLEHYGAEVHDVLSPHFRALKRTKYEVIDPNGRLAWISTLPVKEKYAHPEFLTAERLLAVDEPRLYHARGFFYHAIGCNKLFTGEGCSPDGIPECLTPNMAIADIPGAMLMDLEVTHLDISTLGGFSNSDAIDDS